jgi:hypothetical protein
MHRTLNKHRRRVVFGVIPVVIALSAELCRAGRPLVIDDAAPVALGKIQIEAGAGYFKDSETNHFDAPLTLAYGLLPGLEVGVGSGAQAELREGGDTVGGFADTFLDAKWQVLDQSKYPVSLTFTPTIKLPTADRDETLGSGSTDYDLTVIATRYIGRTGFDVNVGYTILGDTKSGGDDGLWHYGLAVRQPLSDATWLVGDVFAVTPANGGPTTIGMQIGLQHEVLPGWVFDCAAGTGLHDGPDITATVGLTWTF